MLTLGKLSLQGYTRPSKRPRLKHSRSPRTTLLLNVTSAAQEAAAPSLSPMASPTWAGLGTPASSADADDLAGVEPVLQREVVASSLSVKAGRPVAIERVRLICRSLQTDMDDPRDATAPAKLAEALEPAAQPAEKAEDVLQGAAAGPASAGGSDPRKDPGHAQGTSSGGANKAGTGEAPGEPTAETGLQQRQKLMERMQRRLSGLTMPAPLASPGQVRLNTLGW